jgi:hypothetical protein
MTRIGVIFDNQNCFWHGTPCVKKLKAKKENTKFGLSISSVLINLMIWHLRFGLCFADVVIIERLDLSETEEFALQIV